MNLFDHAIDTLYHNSFYGFIPDDTSPKKQVLASNGDDPLSLQLIQSYNHAIESFNKAYSQLEPETLEKIKDGIENLVMHTLTHVGQLIRLQALYIRHIVKKEVDNITI